MAGNSGDRYAMVVLLSTIAFATALGLARPRPVPDFCGADWCVFPLRWTELLGLIAVHSGIAAAAIVVPRCADALGSRLARLPLTWAPRLLVMPVAASVVLASRFLGPTFVAALAASLGLISFVCAASARKFVGPPSTLLLVGGSFAPLVAVFAVVASMPTDLSQTMSASERSEVEGWVSTVEHGYVIAAIAAALVMTWLVASGVVETLSFQTRVLRRVGDATPSWLLPVLPIACAASLFVVGGGEVRPFQEFGGRTVGTMVAVVVGSLWLIVATNRVSQSTTERILQARSRWITALYPLAGLVCALLAFSMLATRARDAVDEAGWGALAMHGLGPMALLMVMVGVLYIWARPAVLLIAGSVGAVFVAWNIVGLRLDWRDKGVEKVMALPAWAVTRHSVVGWFICVVAGLLCLLAVLVIVRVRPSDHASNDARPVLRLARQWSVAVWAPWIILSAYGLIGDSAEPFSALPQPADLAFAFAILAATASVFRRRFRPGVATAFVVVAAGLTGAAMLPLAPAILESRAAFFMLALFPVLSSAIAVMGARGRRKGHPAELLAELALAGLALPAVALLSHAGADSRSGGALLADLNLGDPTILVDHFYALIAVPALVLLAASSAMAPRYPELDAWLHEDVQEYLDPESSEWLHPRFVSETPVLLDVFDFREALLIALSSCHRILAVIRGGLAPDISYDETPRFLPPSTQDSSLHIVVEDLGSLMRRLWTLSNDQQPDVEIANEICERAWAYGEKCHTTDSAYADAVRTLAFAVSWTAALVAGRVAVDAAHREVAAAERWLVINTATSAGSTKSLDAAMAWADLVIRSHYFTVYSDWSAAQLETVLLESTELRHQPALMTLSASGTWAFFARQFRKADEGESIQQTTYEEAEHSYRR